MKVLFKLVPFLFILNSNAVNIKFSKYVHPERMEILQGDLKFLSQYTFNEEAEAKTLKLFDMPSISSSELEEWLDLRVSYVLGEADQSQMLVLGKSVNYPQNGEPAFKKQRVVVFEKAPSEQDSSSKPLDEPKAPTDKPKQDEMEPQGRVVMSNLGAAMYSRGKFDSKVLALNFEEREVKVKPVYVSSPRVGIIHIGEGLFMGQETLGAVDSFANRVIRLSTLFHEARHSDGNGESLSFGHFICPISHAYAGTHACDGNSNGPYTVGSSIILEMLKNCKACTKREMTILKSFYLDSRSRVIPTNINEILINAFNENEELEPIFNEWDPSPEIISIF